MRITSVKIILTPNKTNRLRAYASVTFDDSMVVHDLKVIEGPDRYFISMPDRVCPDGKRLDTVHPINRDFRKTLELAVITQYFASVDVEAAKELADNATH